ncbi:MAG: hypothetical protein KIS96_14440 [Bauldia sp.]|nr:hypothetical protein [Bauldia sp.]
MNEKRCETNKVGASGECLACDAEQGVSCRWPASRQAIERAIEDGKFTRVAPGVRGRQLKEQPSGSGRIPAEMCGPGGRVFRHAFLDERDKDFS